MTVGINQSFVSIAGSTPGDDGYAFNQLRLNTVGAVPEPATLSLLGLGMLGLALRRRRAA